MALSTKIASVCVQMFGAGWGTNADGCRRKYYRVILVPGIFSATFFTIRPLLDYANNLKPKYGWYKGSTLEGLKMSDFS